MRQLIAASAARDLILAGKSLLIAGEDALLATLPPGRWIAGTIPYFVTASGGTCARNQVFVDDLAGYGTEIRIQVYSATQLKSVYTDAKAGTARFIIIPAASATHLAFGMDAPAYPDFAKVPLLGWISGVHLADLGSAAPAVYDGRTATRLTDAAVVLEAPLPAGRFGDLQIVNPFTADPASPEIRFAAPGLVQESAIIDGVSQPFAAFLQSRRHPASLPLVGDYCGTGVNVSFQDIGVGRVALYAPVFPGVTYRLAKPLVDYRDTLASLLGGAWSGTCFNCILNYLHGGLEGKVIGTAAYPCTFGEIGYQLLNQTFVHLDAQA